MAKIKGLTIIISVTTETKKQIVQLLDRMVDKRKVSMHIDDVMDCIFAEGINKLTEDFPAPLADIPQDDEFSFEGFEEEEMP